MLKKTLIVSFFVLGILPTFLSAQTYQMVKDLSPGSQNSFSWADPYQIPMFIGSLGNKMFMVAEGGSDVTGLWETDGTEAGTVRLFDSKPFTYLIEKDAGLAFFPAAEAAGTRAIWQYDGSNMVKLVEGAEYFPTELEYFNNQLYYVTSVGTFDDCFMTPGATPSQPECLLELESATMDGLTNLGGQLIGIGEIPFNMPHLFRSDGTEAGSEFFYDLVGNSNSNWAPNFIEGNGQVFFFYQPGGAGVSMGLYVTDGTDGGTQYLADLWNNGAYPRQSKSKLFFNNKLIVAGNDFSTALGNELYISDGTPGGTGLLKDINSSDSSDPDFFVEYNGLVYFVAIDDSGEKRLWQTDGTESGTVPTFSTLFSGADETCGDFLTIYDGLLAFTGFTEAEGSEIWLSDGTEMGTFSITDESAPGDDDFTPRELVAAQNNLFFNSYNSNTGRELWAYNNGQPNASISASLGQVACDDNGTPSDPADDIITFDLTATGTSLSSSFNIATDIGTVMPGSGNYGDNIQFSMQPGSAGSGNVLVTVSDSDDASFLSTLVVNDPGACSTINSTREFENENHVVVSPNPFNGQVVFQLENLYAAGDYEIRILDITGKVHDVFSIGANGQTIYTVKDNLNGVLFYQLIDTNEGRVMDYGKLISE